MKGQKPLISVVVSAYNIEKYISKCIESLLNQTFNNYEIIIVNDGSTDATGDIVNKYSKNSKCKVFNKSNEGVSVARNYGIDQAIGKYIVQVDGDDFVEKNWIYNSAKYLEKDNPDVLFFGFDSVDSNGHKIKSGDKCSFSSNIYDNKYILTLLSEDKLKNYPWYYFTKKDVLKKMPLVFPNNLEYEDIATTYRIVLNSKKIETIPGIFYHYVRHNNSRSNPSYVNYKQVTDLEIIRDQIRRNLKNKVSIQILNNWDFHLLINEYQILSHDRKKYKSELELRRNLILKAIPNSISKFEYLKILLLKLNIYKNVYPTLAKYKNSLKGK